MTESTGSAGQQGRWLWRGSMIGALGTFMAILIAFSIDAAWDYRSDRKRERTYLDALQGELLATRETIVRHRTDIDRRRLMIKHYLSTVVLIQSATASADTIYALVSHL